MYLILSVLWLSLGVDAIVLTLNTSMNLRTDNNGVLVKSGRVEKGTKVSIPDAFVPNEVLTKMKNGKELSDTDVNKVLNKYLSEQVGNLKKFKGPDGKIKKDYFLNVKIESGKEKGKEGLLAIRYLGRKSGLSLEVTTSTDSYITGFNSGTNVSNETVTYGGSPIPCAIDLATPQTMPAALKNLTNDLGPVLNKVDARAKSFVVGKDIGALDKMSKNFKRSCGPSFEDFIKTVESEATKYGIPKSMLTGVMIRESMGSCNSTDGLGSIGIFQINTNSTSVRFCTKEEQRELVNGPTEELKKGKPPCLSNPYVNLSEALSIMAQKFKRVNGKLPTNGGVRWDSIDKGGQDLWRKALSAYNGGEGHVYQAYYNMNDFSSKFDAQLNLDDWDQRRLFFFRNVLEANGNNNYFNDNQRYRRGINNSIDNIAYVESIVGRYGQEFEGSHLNVAEQIDEVLEV